MFGKFYKKRQLTKTKKTLKNSDNEECMYSLFTRDL